MLQFVLVADVGDESAVEQPDRAHAGADDQGQDQLQGGKSGAQQEPRSHDGEGGQGHAGQEHLLLVEAADEPRDDKRGGQGGDAAGRAVETVPRGTAAFVAAKDVENVGVGDQHPHEKHPRDDKENHQAEGAEGAVLQGQLARVQEVELGLVLHFDFLPGEQGDRQRGQRDDDGQRPGDVANAQHLDFDAIVGRHLHHGLEDKAIPRGLVGGDEVADEFPRTQADFVEPGNEKGGGRGENQAVFLDIGALIVIRGQFQPQRVVGDTKDCIHQIEKDAGRDRIGEERGAPPIRGRHVGDAKGESHKEAPGENERTPAPEPAAAVVRNVAHHRVGNGVEKPRDGDGPTNENRTHAEADVVDRDEQVVQSVGRHLVAEAAHAPRDFLAHGEMVAALSGGVVHEVDEVVGAN